MKKLLALALPIVALALLLGGCGKDGEKDMSSELKAGDVAGANQDEIVATVNGEEILASSVAKEQSMLAQQMAGRVDPSQMQAMAAGLKQQAFVNIVKRILLRQAADKEGLTVSEAEKTAKIEVVKGNFPSEEEFNAQLGISGLTYEAFEKEIEYTVKVEKLIEKLSADIEETTIKDAKNFYDSNTDQFKNPERVKASHILIKTAADDSEEIKAEKRKRIEDLLVRVKGGQKFADVASENSDCPSSKNGGDLGFFSRGQMVKPFEDAAFELEKGEISGIVETRFGYHIIMLTEKEPANTTPFDEISNDIVEYLFSMKKQMEVEKYIQALKDLAEIEYSDSTLMIQ
ncbi:MAG: peptidylprolyl isomerase [Candidatus Krumholzibacteriota bacterium]|nr:peptidylprolyl isomerase [Candidatus Krumholzibacteriota bacterium]